MQVGQAYAHMAEAGEEPAMISQKPDMMNDSWSISSMQDSSLQDLPDMA